jgi:protein phosphatase
MPAGEQASAMVVRELAALDPGGSMASPLPDALDSQGWQTTTADVASVPDDGEPPTVRLVSLDAADPADPTAPLRAAVANANRKIRQIIETDQETDAMGTTVTAMVLAGDQVGLLHVGDSRAYRLHEGTLTQVTRDDTYVQTLVDEGVISIDEARNHPRRSVVMQAVQGLSYEPACTTLPAVVGDRYLLCSDGLTDVVSDKAIQGALEMEVDRARCAQTLVRHALHGGGPDNVTVIVVDIVRA